MGFCYYQSCLHTSLKIISKPYLTPDFDLLISFNITVLNAYSYKKEISMTKLSEEVVSLSLFRVWFYSCSMQINVFSTFMLLEIQKLE